VRNRLSERATKNCVSKLEKLGLLSVTRYKFRYRFRFSNRYGLDVLVKRMEKVLQENGWRKHETLPSAATTAADEQKTDSKIRIAENGHE